MKRIVLFLSVLFIPSFANAEESTFNLATSRCGGLSECAGDIDNDFSAIVDDEDANMNWNMDDFDRFGRDRILPIPFRRYICYASAGRGHGGFRTFSGVGMSIREASRRAMQKCRNFAGWSCHIIRCMPIGRGGHPFD